MKGKIQSQADSNVYATAVEGANQGRGGKQEQGAHEPATFPSSSDSAATSASVGRSRLQNYSIKELIESGSTSNVFYGVDARNKRPVAVKVISRTKYVGRERKEVRENRIFRETLVSFLLDHKGIVKLKDFFFTEEYFYLVFDYVKGTQLLKKIIKQGTISEKTARKYFLQVLMAIDYCHRHSLVHRDIKIENILIDSEDNAVLIDFGLSNFYDKDGFLGTFCGSLYFAAPELLSANPYCGPEVDVWSLGVVLYVMLCGKVPFDDQNMQSLYQKIIQARISVSGVSLEVAELIRRMLDPNRATRITVGEIMEHPWVAAQRPADDRARPAMDSGLVAYINYLFGNQFEPVLQGPDKKEANKGGPVLNLKLALASMYKLFKSKHRSHSFLEKARGKGATARSESRAESIMEFINGRRLAIKKSLLRHWSGIKTREDVVVKGLESIMNELGVTFEMANGKYACSIQDMQFVVRLVKNRFSRAYGVELERRAGRRKEIKDLEAFIRKRLKAASFHIDLDVSQQ